MLSFEGISVCYRPGEAAVRGLSFRVPAGSCTVVAGAAGSGKSTVANCAAGIIPHLTVPAAMSGEVVLDGRRLTDLDPAEVYRRVGVVLQRVDDQLWNLNVEDLLAFPLENRGVPGPEVRRRVEGIVRERGLTALVGRPVRSLSGGEKRLVALAAALAGRPRLVVLDEPSTGLDPGARLRLRATLQSLRAGGQTVLVTEQDLSWLLDIADQVVLLAPDGHLLGTWSPAELLHRPEAWAAAELEAPPLVCLGWELRRSGVPVRMEAMQTVSSAAAHLLGEGFPAGTVVRRMVAPKGGAPGPTNGLSNAPMSPLLEVRDLTVRLPPSGGRRVPPVLVDHVNLHLCPGEVVALVGPNGAGKTTLFRQILGLLPVQQGAVVLQGTSTHGWTPARRARYVGLVFQHPWRLFFCGSVREELLFSRSVAAGPRAPGSRGDPIFDPDPLLRGTGLQDKADLSPLTLSLREQQRLALACLQVTEPLVTLFDEPLIGWDSRWRRTFLEFLDAGRRAGRAAVLATHDLDLAQEVADRLLLVAGGQIGFDGPIHLGWESQAFRALGWPAPALAELAVALGTGATGSPDFAAVNTSYHDSAEWQGINPANGTKR